jgi:hypothetical protein
MMWNTPGTGVEVQPLGELSLLREATELGVGVAAVDGPVAPARAIVVFEDLHAIAGFAQLVGSGHAGDAGPENQDRRALDVARELDRSGVAGLAGVAQLAHRLVHHGAAGCRTNHPKQRAPTDGRGRLNHHVL